MRQALCLATLLGVVSPMASAQTPPDTVRLAEAKRELRQMFKELDEALRRRDQAALERIYADEFVFVHARAGGAVSRADHIKGAMSAPADAAVPVPDFESILLYGDVAVLRSLEATRSSTPTYITSMYVKRQGRWQILQLQGTPFSSPRKAVVVDPKVLASYVGKYEQAPGRFADVTLQGDGLRIVFPNAFAWTLRPSGEDRFFVPDSLNQIMFHRTDDGHVKYYTALPATGEIIKGMKVN